MRASPASGLDARWVPRSRPEGSSSQSARVARRGVAPWVVPPRSARLWPRRPLAARASSDDVPSGEAPAGEAPARSKSNSVRAKGGGGVRAARGRPANASSEWRDPAMKAASTRAKAAERRGASLDSQEEGASTSSSAAEVVATTSNGARGRRRDRSLRSKRNQSGSKTPNANTNDPFASLARGALTAELEKELGRAVQELLRAEAMRNRLCEETIAAEMRADDVADDVFSKAFGKKTVRGVGKQNPRSINPSRNVSRSPRRTTGGLPRKKTETASRTRTTRRSSPRRRRFENVWRWRSGTRTRALWIWRWRKGAPRGARS